MIFDNPSHKSQNVSSIDTAVKELNDAWAAASQDIYNATQQAPPADGAAPHADAKDNGNVQDVDFEEVKEDKQA